MIRIGALHYSNVLPFFYPLSTGKVPYPGTLVWGTPREVNSMLEKKEVDIAMVSSLSYVDRREDAVLLSDLGIASTESIMSVCLFTPKGVDPSTFREILLTTESETSVRLLRVLCNHFWRISPQLTRSTLSPELLLKQDKPFLIIGDSCLAILENTKFTAIDLAKAWHLATRKSFIFALLATNNSSLQAHSEEIFEFHRSIDEAFHWSQKNLDEIVSYASQRIPTISEKKLFEYYQKSLEFRLSSRHFQGLDYFIRLEEKSLEPHQEPQIIGSNPYQYPIDPLSFSNLNLGDESSR